MVNTFSRASSALVSFALALSGAAACNVKATSSSTGGVDAGDAAAGSCDRGVVVVTSDYQSTNVALTAVDGTTLSGSFVSSGTAASGLALALSGDVDVPSARPASGRVVLLDRYGTDVITWLDPATANVIAQLPVGTGFDSNPQDYLEVSDTKAYVSRYETNAKAGAQPNDGGGDLLILDTHAPSITGRIAMPGDGALLPRPSRMLRVRDQVIVVLERESVDFKQVGDGMLVGVSIATDAIAWTLPVTGLGSCGRAVLAPSGNTFAIACSGQFDQASGSFDVAHSDVILFDATSTPPKELRRYGVAAKLGASLQPNLAFAAERSLIGETFGSLDGSQPDRAFSLDLDSGASTVLLTAGKAYALGGVWCSPGCGDVCLLSDASANVLQRWHVNAATFEPLAPSTVETKVGLPPRSLGAY